MARAARLVALSVGGGAAITLVGATAAHAGDADSTGNQSSTQAAQTLNIDKDHDATVADLDAHVSNAGASGANTGVNSVEDSELHTGNAHGMGNQAGNKLNQAATSSASGGGTTVITQKARIHSWGGAWADTGFNDGDGVVTGDAWAWGNRSFSSIDQSEQILDGAGVLRVADQYASIGNLGGAAAETGFNSGDGDLSTGNASSTGNDSTSSTGQSGTVTVDSIGTALSDQVSRTRNRGLALANSGHNTTTGDDSFNDPEVEEDSPVEDGTSFPTDLQDAFNNTDFDTP